MVAVLFARSDSVYKKIDGCEVYDMVRDARTFNGLQPVVAHPPCRAWARLRGLAKPRHDEKDLAILAVDKVRKNGGVLEHPESSTLWNVAGLPNPLIVAPGTKDDFGGWTLVIDQSWFGHLARKRTWLYIVGVEPKNIPPFDLMLGEESYTVSRSKRSKPWKKEIPRSHREATPLKMALWLVELARLAA
jgi:hypothetical protein